MKSVLGKVAGSVAVMLLVFGVLGCSTEAGGGNNITTSSGEVISTGIKIGETVLEKTSEVVIIPAGTTGVVDMRDNSSWNTYLPEDNEDIGDYWKGVFIKDRKVTLSSFVMSQYEVTQELYETVMGENPSRFQGNDNLPAEGETQKLRPVEYLKHYEAVAFCNELTKLVMSEDDVVYFSDAEMSTPYTKDNAANKLVPYMDITKKGYRLPTEAEWEYAARGGDTSKPEWKNAFGTVNTKDDANIYDGSNYLEEDENLATVGWYYYNSNSDNPSRKNHEVGKKAANALNLYDMSGNVWEWCWDWYSGTVATEVVTDPCGAASGSYRVCRGGSWGDNAYECAVSCRYYFIPDGRFNGLGFRLVRNAN